MLDLLRPPYPWDRRQPVLRVLVFVILVLSEITLVGFGATPNVAVGVLVATGVAAPEIAQRLLRPEHGIGR